MKGNAFGDRAKLLAEWFQDWNSCEQTIALYSLLSKVSATQARFLSLVLEHSLKNGCDSQELSKLEKQANNAAFLHSLQGQTMENALSQLLAHLPLLNPGNAEARREYMTLLPKVLLSSIEELDYLDQCRQLLSLALVHPAFPHDDREALTFWLFRLDEKIRNIMEKKQSPPQRPPPLPPRKIYPIQSLDEAGGAHSSSTIEITGFLEPTLEEDELRSRSNSLQMNQRIYSLHDGPPIPSNGIRDPFLDKSKSLPSGPHSKGLLNLLLEEQQYEWKGGMKDVPAWLKSLRLHKYQHLFADLNYEEMLQMKEDYLEEKSVTKGARTKIILSIRKLARRPETLADIEQDMEKHGRLLFCISELRLMLMTPIKPYSSSEVPTREHTASQERKDRRGSGDGVGDGGVTAGSGDEEGDDSSSGRSGSPTSSPQAQHSSSDGGSDLEELLGKDFPNEDLPSLITRAIGKAYSQLMLHTDTNEENLGAFVKLLDTALQHEAFTVDQRKMFFEWKQSSQHTLRVISPKKQPRGRSYGPGSFYTFAGMPSHMSRGGKSRSLRAPVRNGGLQGKAMQLPNSPRSSSTLPRMSSRQLQQPLPHHASFIRPKSNIFPASQMSAQAKPFLPPPHTATSSPYAPPPPLPPRTYEVNEKYMDDMCKSVIEQALPSDDLSDS